MPHKMDARHIFLKDIFSTLSSVRHFVNDGELFENFRWYLYGRTHLFKGIYLSKIVTCMIFFLYKQKLLFILWHIVV